MDKYFFEIPVYRLSEVAYRAKRKNELSIRFENYKKIMPNNESSLRYRDIIEETWLKKFGDWDFNEIVGYIRLYFIGSQIRGEYFSAEKKYTRRSRSNKIFKLETEKLAPEIEAIDYYSDKTTNEQIFEAIKRYITDCKNELTRGRFIDDRMLMAVGPYVEWRTMIG